MRRVVTLLTILGLAAPLYVSEAEAVFTEVCSPSPKVATSFCVSHDFTPGTNVAGKATDVFFSFVNSSTNVGSDKPRWLKDLTIDMLDLPGSTSSVTPGASLPNGLRIAGGDADCTQPDFDTCAAGSGAVRGTVDNTAFFDGTYNGAYGIQEVTNVAPPTAGSIATFFLDGEACVDIGADICQTFDATVEIKESNAGVVQLSIPTSNAWSVNFAGDQGDVDVSILTLEAHLEGTSNVDTNGTSLPQTYTIFQLPATCTVVTGDGLYESRDGRLVSIDRNIPVQNCTTSSVRGKAGRKVKVSGLVTEGDAPNPFQTGTTVKVELFAKKSGGFKLKGTQEAPFDAATGTFATAFKLPRATKCMVVATFPGDSNHGPSSATTTFRC